MELYTGGILNLPDDYLRKYIDNKNQGDNDVEKLLVDIVDDTKKQIKEGLFSCFESLYEKDYEGWEPPTKEDLYKIIQDL